jgi:3-methyladenine DNA glycosylase AlkD
VTLPEYTPGMLDALKRDLAAQADPAKAAFYPRFFKTGPGQYGEGDIFLGVTMPKQRAIAKQYRDLPFADIKRLLADPVHEHRMVALEILVMQYERGDDGVKKRVVDFYLSHLDGVNNWDLVDGSAPYILGDWLLTKDTMLLDDFARSAHLWTQRVAIVATYTFIRAGRFDETLRISEILLRHPHDLIHKAVGWMLREVGKKDDRALRRFLDEHAAVMPRTMLRYAIEKMQPDERKAYMAMKARVRQ